MADDKLQLYLSHRAALLDYAAPIVGCRARAEDVVQEAFIKFVPQQAEAPSALKAYLFRVVRNLALDVRKRRRYDLRERPDDTPFWGLPQDHGSPEDHALFCDQVRQVSEILNEMPADTRLALEMHRFGGYRMEDIAVHLGVSVATAHRLVKTGLAEFVRKMK